MTPQTRQIIDDVARSRRLDPIAILGKRRFQRLVQARIEIAKRLKSDRGYSHNRIAAILNRDHTTICFYLGGLESKPPPVDIVKVPVVPYAGFDTSEKQDVYRPRKKQPVAERPIATKVKGLVPYAGFQRSRGDG